MHFENHVKIWSILSLQTPFSFALFGFDTVLLEPLYY